MKGFILKYKGKEYKVGSPEDSGIVGISLHYFTKRDESGIIVSGQDDLKSFVWINETIDEEATLEISFQKIDGISPYSREILHEENKEFDEFVIKSKVSSYYKLKKELEEGGYI